MYGYQKSKIFGIFGSEIFVTIKQSWKWSKI